MIFFQVGVREDVVVNGVGDERNLQVGWRRWESGSRSETFAKTFHRVQLARRKVLGALWVDQALRDERNF